MNSFVYFSMGAWVFFYLLAPETKRKTLEQIEVHWHSGKSARTLRYQEGPNNETDRFHMQSVW